MSWWRLESVSDGCVEERLTMQSDMERWCASASINEVLPKEIAELTYRN